jgi:hypothetical protein
LWFWNLQHISVCSCVPELPSVIPIICWLSISGSPDIAVMKKFGIFNESLMLNNLQSIAHHNGCQLQNSPETDRVQYISNHQWIEWLSKRYPDDVSYPDTRLAYATPPRGILPSISSVRNAVQAHLTSTLLPRLMVSDLTLYTYSIHRPIFTIRFSVLTHHSTPGYDPTTAMFLNSVYPLHSALEWFVLLHSKNISSFLNALNLWLPASSECHRSHTKLLGADVAYPS